MLNRPVDVLHALKRKRTWTNAIGMACIGGVIAAIAIALGMDVLLALLAPALFFGGSVGVDAAAIGHLARRG